MGPATTGKLNQVRALLRGRTSRDEESELLQILNDAGADELGELLAAIDLKELISSVDDHDGAKNRIWLLELLTGTRVRDLPVSVRVDLVTALQKGRTSKREEIAIADVFLATRGTELTALKNGVDRGDYHDLRQLVFNDLDDEILRKKILDHIAREAVASPVGGVKVLSDIDDTFFCNLKDRRYPKKTTYPGVLQFYAELVRGPDDAGLGSLTFLTARPAVPFGATEEHSRRGLAARGLAMEFAILCGDFLHLIGNEHIAAAKVANFRDYGAVFPEYGFVFTGDSGQGDAIAGAAMLEVPSSSVRAVFIHDVVDTQQDERARQRALGVQFFDTYAGAALEAFHAGLVSAAGVRRVLAAARSSVAAITFASAAQRAAREAELARDAARIGAEIGHGDGTDPDPPKAKAARV